MPFKIRCRLVAFMGDPEHFPCHFGYEIGDEFTFNGERFEGRVCPGLFYNMAPVIWHLLQMGSRAYGQSLMRYSGHSARDLGMKKYDGVGFRPLKAPPAGIDEKFLALVPAERLTEREKGFHFVCTDCRTSAFFKAEAVDLADGGYALPYYKREMSVLEKIKKEPGMTSDEILNRFNEWEREEVYPALTPLNVPLMLEELAEVDYIELRDGKAYPRKPPA